MTDTSRQATGQQDIMRFIRAHMRDYALLISLLAIMIFFQFATDGTLFKPVNMTNLILQNSYIVIMALGMLLIIVAGHIDLSVGFLSGFVGAIAGVVCLWGVTGLKKLLRADDSLDVFGVHGIGGITGALLTGVFAAPSLGGAGIWDYVTETALADYSIASQVWIQAQGVLTTIVVSSVVSVVAFLIVKATVGLRVSEDAEREGLDITSHGETAYEL